MTPKERLITALDVDTEAKALSLVRTLGKDVKFFKVGLELFTSCGPAIVGKIREIGCEVFLDLKFHDIPNTVARASAAATRLGAYMFTVHASGGLEMMKAASDAAQDEAGRMKSRKPRVIAVTVLTSMDEKALKKIGVDANMNDQVLELAKLAKEAGLDGVVASPREARLIREEIGKDFLIVTPGVRPKTAGVHDQKRVATPKEAVEAGADQLVVGRPITEATDPAASARAILHEIE